jgi:hypothetical protein
MNISPKKKKIEMMKKNYAVIQNVYSCHNNGDHKNIYKGSDEISLKHKIRQKLEKNNNLLRQ